MPSALALLAPSLLAVFALMLGPDLSDLVVKVMILSIFALSLELLVGMTGLVSLGHAAFFGIGAYATVLGSRQGRRLDRAGCCRWPWARPRPMRWWSAR